MEPMLDSERRSSIQASVTTTVVAVPGDVHEKIREIVSLLSRALVLSLGLLKTIMSTREVSGDNRIDNRSEHMVLEEGPLELGEAMESLVRAPMPGTSVAQQGHGAAFIDNRDTSAITVERGRGVWGGYTGMRADEASPVADTSNVDIVEL